MSEFGRVYFAEFKDLFHPLEEAVVNERIEERI